MKNFTIFFLFIILIINSPVFGQYSVKLRIGEIVNPLSPEHPFEWRVTIYADIFDANKNLVPHSSNYHYYWYFHGCHEPFRDTDSITNIQSANRNS